MERKIKIPTKEERRIVELEKENLSNMMAMTEMFEKNIRLEEENANTMVGLTELFEIVLGGK